MIRSLLIYFSRFSSYMQVLRLLNGYYLVNVDFRTKEEVYWKVVIEH